MQAAARAEAANQLEATDQQAAAAQLAVAARKVLRASLCSWRDQAKTQAAAAAQLAVAAMHRARKVLRASLCGWHKQADWQARHDDLRLRLLAARKRRYKLQLVVDCWKMRVQHARTLAHLAQLLGASRARARAARDKRQARACLVAWRDAAVLPAMRGGVVASHLAAQRGERLLRSVLRTWQRRAALQAAAAAMARRQRLQAAWAVWRGAVVRRQQLAAHWAECCSNLKAAAAAVNAIINGAQQHPSAELPAANTSTPQPAAAAPAQLISSAGSTSTTQAAAAPTAPQGWGAGARRLFSGAAQGACRGARAILRQAACFGAHQQQQQEQLPQQVAPPPHPGAASSTPPSVEVRPSGARGLRVSDQPLAHYGGLAPGWHGGLAPAWHAQLCAPFAAHPVICHLSSVICHLSSVICHLSRCGLA
jgi:hypothetical protein